MIVSPVAFAKHLLRPLVMSWRSRRSTRAMFERKKTVRRWLETSWLGDDSFLDAWRALGRCDYHRALELVALAEKKSGPQPWARYIDGAVDSLVLPALRRNFGEGRHLLIKEWSCGFWADVDHLLGQFLIAEWTKRIPVVYWGTSSLYHPGNLDNCFPLFFRPSSSVTIDDLVRPGLSYFPLEFNATNLRLHREDQFSRPGATDKGFSVLHREETVLVSDRHVGLEFLWSYWVSRSIQPVDSFETTARRLFTQYLVPSPTVSQRVDAFWKTLSTAGPCFAVHVRGGDRTESLDKLDENNRLYFQAVDPFLEADSQALIFLLTDSTYILEKFVERYGLRVRFTTAQRSSNKEGIHYAAHTSKAELGFETLVDVLVALRCDRFLGCTSNVSKFVHLLKDWGGAGRLLANVPSIIL